MCLRWHTAPRRKQETQPTASRLWDKEAPDVAVKMIFKNEGGKSNTGREQIKSLYKYIISNLWLIFYKVLDQ